MALAGIGISVDIYLNKRNAESCSKSKAAVVKAALANSTASIKGKTRAFKSGFKKYIDSVNNLNL